MKKATLTRIIALCLCAVFALGVFTSCGNKVTVESLLKDGKYQEAFDKAEESQKKEISAETAVASALNSLVEDWNATINLKDAYYNDGSESEYINTNGVVLYTSTDKDEETGYILLLYRESSGDFEYNTATYSLERDGDSMKNMYRSTIESIMDNGIKLDKDAVERVQTMYENNTLSDIEFIPSN